MEYQSKKLTVSTPVEADSKFDLDALLHPARAFAHPMDVVRDPDLTLNEKRAILSSWASDACAVEAAPELRSIASGTIVRSSWTLYEHLMRNTATINRFLTTSASSQRKMLACSEQGRVCAALTIKGTRLTRATVKCHKQLSPWGEQDKSKVGR